MENTKVHGGPGKLVVAMVTTLLLWIYTDISSDDWEFTLMQIYAVLVLIGSGLLLCLAPLVMAFVANNIKGVQKTTIVCILVCFGIVSLVSGIIYAVWIFGSDDLKESNLFGTVRVFLWITLVSSILSP